MDVADTPERHETLRLSAKLLALLRLRRDQDGFVPSAREVADATALPGQRKSSVSHGQVNGLMNGTSSNPTMSTVAALARALDAPPAFLLPGSAWDDLAALTVYEKSPEAREALRLMQDLQ